MDNKEFLATLKEFKDKDIVKKTLNVYIFIDEVAQRIAYVHKGGSISRNLSNPEEWVRAEVFCSLLDYGYDAKHIELEYPVTMGSTTVYADILLFQPNVQYGGLEPYILIECKKVQTSTSEFDQAIKQAYSYAYALPNTIKYVGAHQGNKKAYFEFNTLKPVHKSVIDIPRAGQMLTLNFSYCKGGKFTDKSGKIHQCNDLKKVTENDLARRFQLAHTALWEGGKLAPTRAFDEFNKILFCKIWDEKQTRKTGDIYEFQIFDGETTDQLKIRIERLYAVGKQKDPEVFNRPIELDGEKIKDIVEFLQEVNFLKTDLDSKGRAFETFMGDYFRGQSGQFFTPRTVVQFIVDALPITHQSKVLDTSCGSGGFLLYALDKVRRQASKDFPKYKYIEGGEEKSDAEQYSYWHEQWHTFAEKNLFGIELNDDIARVAKMNMIIHDDGHTNVINIDGLTPIHIIKEKNKGFDKNSFDFIITNPPFGSKVRQAEKVYLAATQATNPNAAPYYGLSQKAVDWIDAMTRKRDAKTEYYETQSTEVLFIEQCYYFLREGGILAVVIPDGMLTNSSLQYVRDNIEKMFKILAIVSLPQTAFTHTGAGVKTSVLFLQKYSDQESQNFQNDLAKLQREASLKIDLSNKYDSYELQKKNALKQLGKLPKNATEAQTQAFNAQKETINETFSSQIENLFDEATDKLEQLKTEAAQYKRFANYPVFMAIAENIGYDATGKTTQANDLQHLSTEIHAFITDPNFQLPPL